MTNKTIADWLMWTLIGVVVLSVLGAEPTLIGLVVLVNWGWVITSIVRLRKLTNEVSPLK